MKTLQIIDYNQQVLAVFRAKPEGGLEFEILQRGHSRAFARLLWEITSKPLPLSSFQRIYLPDRVRMDTHVRQVTPKDEDFLWAVREFLDHYKLDDLPILGKFVDTADAVAQPVESGCVE